MMKPTGDLCLCAEKKLRSAVYPTTKSQAAEKWQRWDEELVEEFDLWMIRFGKVMLTVSIGVLILFLVGWL
jgi:hypothetical protein